MWVGMWQPFCKDLLMNNVRPEERCGLSWGTCGWCENRNEGQEDRGDVGGRGGASARPQLQPPGHSGAGSMRLPTSTHDRDPGEAPISGVADGPGSVVVECAAEAEAGRGLRWACASSRRLLPGLRTSSGRSLAWSRERSQCPAGRCRAVRGEQALDQVIGRSRGRECRRGQRVDVTSDGKVLDKAKGFNRDRPWIARLPSVSP